MFQLKYFQCNIPFLSLRSLHRKWVRLPSSLPSPWHGRPLSHQPGNNIQRGTLSLVQIYPDTVRWLVEVIVLLHQLSYAIKTQSKAPKAPFLVVFLAFSYVFMAKDWLPCTERIYYRRWRQQYTDTFCAHLSSCLYVTLWPREHQSEQHPHLVGLRHFLFSISSPLNPLSAGGRSEIELNQLKIFFIFWQKIIISGQTGARTA